MPGSIAHELTAEQHSPPYMHWQPESAVMLQLSGACSPVTYPAQVYGQHQLAVLCHWAARPERHIKHTMLCSARYAERYVQ